MNLSNNTGAIVNGTTAIVKTVSSSINMEYLICAIVIAVIIVIFTIVSGYVVKKRIYYASRFGKVEHSTGRLVGLCLIVSFFVEYFDLGYTLICIIVCFVIWVTYLLSHTFEKLFYGHSGPRG